MDIVTSTLQQIYVPGAIVEWTWGYDQTNVDYFLVTKRTDKMVTLQPIGQKNVPSNDDAWLTGHCVPDPESVLPEPPIRRKVQVWGDKEQGIRIKSYGWASLWDGKPSRWSAYA